MLFDLRSSGRRRMVKIVYVTLAVLMGGGLVLFGIGGGGALSGGLLDAITESNNSGGSSSDRVQKQEAAATAKARANPTDAAAWAAVARARYALAQTGDNFDQGSSAFTAAGKRQLEAASRAWEEHLKLAGKKPDPRVASLMVQVYSTLGQADKAAGAQEVIADARGSAGAYAQLAILAYQAGQTRKGDLAAAKAVEETPKEDRQSLKGQLQSAKAQAAQGTGSGQSP
jgi:hypothetical protein